MNDWPEPWRKLLAQRPALGSPRVRWGLAGLVLVSLLGLVAWPREQEVALFPGASRPAAELRTTLAHLKQSGLTEARVRNGQLFVPASRRADAQAALQTLAAATPTPARSADSSSSPLGSLWPATESQRQEQQDSQRAAELVEMFQTDPNVATAKLVWNRNRRRSFGHEPRTTVVLGLTPRAGRDVSHELAESFQMAIVSAFGLTGPDDVTLIVNGPDGARWVRGEAHDPPGPAHRGQIGTRSGLAASGDTRGSLFASSSPARLDPDELFADESPADEALPEKALPGESGRRDVSRNDVARRNAARRTGPPNSATARVTRANAEFAENAPAETRRSVPETFEPPAPRTLPDNPAAQLQQELSRQLAWIPGVRVRVDRVTTSLSPHVARRPSRNGLAGSQTGVQRTALINEPGPGADRRPYEVVVEVPAKVTRTLAPLRRGGQPANESGPPAPTRDEVSRRVEQIVHRLSPTSNEAGEPVETSVLVLFSEPVDSGFPNLAWLNPRAWGPVASSGWTAWGALGAGLLSLPAWAWRRRRRRVAQRRATRSGREPEHAAAGAERGPRTSGPRERLRHDRDDQPEPVSLAAQLLNAEVPAAVTQFAAPTVASGGKPDVAPPPAARSAAGPAAASPGTGSRPANSPAPTSAAGHQAGATRLVPANPPPGSSSTSVSPTAAASFAQSVPAVSLEPRATPGLPWATEAGGERTAAPPAGVPEGPREFRLLDDCTADEWRLLLAEETPQSIACVVARLSAAQATFVLRLLPATTRLDVIRRLAGLELPSPTILREFGLALAERLHTIRTTPSASVVAVTRPAAPTHNAPTSTAPAPTTPAPTTPAPAPPLAGNPRPSIGTLAAGPLARGNMAAGTSSPVTSPTASRPASSATPEATGAGSSADFPTPADPAHATEDSSPAIPPTPFIELRMLDDGSLRELYVMFDPQVWAVALAGAPRALTEKLLGSLPPGSAAELQGTLARGAASDAAAVAAAQHEIEQRLAPLRWRGRRSVRALRRGTRP